MQRDVRLSDMKCKVREGLHLVLSAAALLVCSSCTPHQSQCVSHAVSSAACFQSAVMVLLLAQMHSKVSVSVWPRLTRRPLWRGSCALLCLRFLVFPSTSCSVYVNVLWGVFENEDFSSGLVVQMRWSVWTSLTFPGFTLVSMARGGAYGPTALPYDTLSG